MTCVTCGETFDPTRRLHTCTPMPGAYGYHQSERQYIMTSTVAYHPSRYQDFSLAPIASMDDDRGMATLLADLLHLHPGEVRVTAVREPETRSWRYRATVRPAASTQVYAAEVIVSDLQQRVAAGTASELSELMAEVVRAMTREFRALLAPAVTVIHGPPAEDAALPGKRALDLKAE